MYILMTFNCTRIISNNFHISIEQSTSCNEFGIVTLFVNSYFKWEHETLYI